VIPLMRKTYMPRSKPRKAAQWEQLPVHENEG